ncbi:MAG: hypothetical protein F4117_00825 [Acidimicrobiales bacterium]|nr:hypothetical protein [Acidimicrobiales bacterium]MYB80810.1 hypothetical protein [Acidimicrobiales bacterium]MYI11096.1 hypothetical protein [Acidimicrobiales bacterium]
MADTRNPFEPEIPVEEAMNRMDAVQADFEQTCDLLIGRLVRLFEGVKYQFAILALIGEVPHDAEMSVQRAFMDKFRDDGRFRSKTLSRACQTVPELQSVVDRFNVLRDTRNTVVHAHYGESMVFLAGMGEPVFQGKDADGEMTLISATALRQTIEDAEKLLEDSAAYGPSLNERRRA